MVSGFMSSLEPPDVPLNQLPPRTYKYYLDDPAGEGSLVYGFGTWNEFDWSSSIDLCGFPGTGCNIALVSRRETRRIGSGVLRVPSVG